VIIHNEHYEKLLRRIEWLQSSNSALVKENAALRASEESLASTVRGLEFENEKLERENAALERTIENLRIRLWGTEFELEKANTALDLLNSHCMSADPIMGRSTYRWTIEHDEPDIRAFIDELRKVTRA
jgi:predicted nuclease with TOPRIM domain